MSGKSSVTLELSILFIFQEKHTNPSDNFVLPAYFFVLNRYLEKTKQLMLTWFSRSPKAILSGGKEKSTQQLWKIKKKKKILFRCFGCENMNSKAKFEKD